VNDIYPIPQSTRRERRRRLDEIYRRIARRGLASAEQAIFQRRVFSACDELEVRFADGHGGGLGAELLWTLASLAPAILDPAPRPGAAPGLLPHPQVFDGRETAGRLRGVVAAFDGAGAATPRAAAWCRLLSLTFETVEALTHFRHPAGHQEIVGECFEVLGAAAAFLESTLEVAS
jgi:hypothetical protein